MAATGLRPYTMNAMPVFLEIRSGPQTGTKIRLSPGQPVRIGRTRKADFTFADDTHMSGVHFSAECLENGCAIKDLESRNGCWLNGNRVTEAILKNGDTFTAGETNFVVSVAAEEEAATEVIPIASDLPTAVLTIADTPQDRVLALLREEFQPLYAILDAARDIRILALLLHHKEQCQSLYEGEQGATLAQVAPYLVRLVKESLLLEAVVKEGWGKNWGVYLTSPSDLQEVRRHLRHFLQVKLPSGEQVYFRFYDPRVMRVFLPTCTPEDTTQFFGPIQNYLVEDENPKKLFRFVNTGKGSERMMIALVDQDELSSESTPADGAPETETWLDGPLADGAK